ncbi:MAG: hypothetical protein ABSG57_12820 [Candidatus Bathyarchaeia archaeon]
MPRAILNWMSKEEAQAASRAELRVGGARFLMLIGGIILHAVLARKIAC